MRQLSTVSFVSFSSIFWKNKLDRGASICYSEMSQNNPYGVSPYNIRDHEGALA